jgi:hypothetical protein
MRTAIAITSLFFLASCGGVSETSSAGASTSQSTTVAGTTTAIRVQSVDAPADGARICGPVVLSVTGAGISSLELLPESGSAGLGRFVRNTNSDKWVLNFDPNTVAKDSVVMLRIAGRMASAPEKEVEVMRRHWLNAESCTPVTEA